MTLKNKRIFIVEDDLRNKAIAQTLLEHAGATTAFDRWGLDTVTKLLAFEPIDIILLDLMLPRGASGYNIIKEIRAHKAFARVPIIAVSAADASEAIPLAQKAGFSGFIAKPIDFQKFSTQIAQILNGDIIWQTSS